MLDNLDLLGLFASTWDLLCGRKKEPEPQETQEEKQEDTYYPEEVNPVKVTFRPQTLDQYIGQENAKERVRILLTKIMNLNKYSHTLIVGSAGTGKSTLAGIIGNHLDFEVTYHTGGDFTKEALKDFLIKNEVGKPHILFIDEIHLLDKKLGEYMYPLTEDFKLVGTETVNIRPFIFLGATTDFFTMLKKFKPLVDRLGGEPIYLEQYNAEEMMQIIKQYNKKVYNENIEENVFFKLCVNCRFTPRIALAMFDDFMACKNIDRVLKSRRIIKDSLTTTDIKILEHLIEIGKPIGEEALAITAQVEKQNYKLWFEPFLIQQGLLTRRSRGRVATEKARKLLEELK